MCYMENKIYIYENLLSQKNQPFYKFFTMKIWRYTVNTEYYGVLAANLECLNKLNWYLLLTKGIIILLWKEENEAAVSLLINFMPQHCIMMCVHTCVCADAS